MPPGVGGDVVVSVPRYVAGVAMVCHATWRAWQGGVNFPEAIVLERGGFGEVMSSHGGLLHNKAFNVVNEKERMFD